MCEELLTKREVLAGTAVVRRSIQCAAIVGGGLNEAPLSLEQVGAVEAEVRVAGLQADGVIEFIDGGIPGFRGCQFARHRGKGRCRLAEIGECLICAAGVFTRPDGLPYAHSRTQHESHGHDRRSDERAFVAHDKPSRAISDGRRTGHDGLRTQMPLDVLRQSSGGVIAPIAVFFDGAHDDPVEVALQDADEVRGLGVAMLRDGCERLAPDRCQGCRGALRLLFPDDLTDSFHAVLLHLFPCEGRVSGQQFIKEDAETVHIATGVDVERGGLRLLGRHVERRSDDLADLGVERVFTDS